MTPTRVGDKPWWWSSPGARHTYTEYDNDLLPNTHRYQLFSTRGMGLARVGRGHLNLKTSSMAHRHRDTEYVKERSIGATAGFLAPCPPRSSAGLRLQADPTVFD